MPLERLQLVLIWLLITAAVVFLLERVVVLFQLFATPLLLFSLAWLMALALRPLIDRLMQVTVPLPQQVSALGFRYTFKADTWTVPRSVAVVLVYIALLTLVVVLGVLLIPPLLQQITNLQDILIGAVNEVTRWTTDFERKLNERGWTVDVTAVLRPEMLGQQATALGSVLAQQSLGIASGIASIVIDVILIIIISFYMALDGPRLVARFMALLPETWHDETRTLVSIVDRTFGGFLRAQILQALFYGLATATLMAALGLQDVTLASVLATVLVLIPLIGGVFAIIPPLIIVLIEAPDRFFLMLFSLIILQQTLFNVVMPRLMGKIVGLHPLLVFGAILVGATVAGAWGVLFGIPVAGVIASVLQFIYLRATNQRATVVGAPPP